MKTLLNDIRFEITHLSTTRSALRNFTLAIAVIAFVIAALGFYKSAPAWIAWMIGGILFSLIALTAPVLIKPVYLAVGSVAAVIGYFLSRIILTLIFIFLVTPVSLVMRMIGKDPLHRRPDDKATSYWIPKKKATPSPEDYEKLY